MRVDVTMNAPGPLTRLVFATVIADDRQTATAHVSIVEVGEEHVAEDLANSLCAKIPTLDRAEVEDLITPQLPRFGILAAH